MQRAAERAIHIDVSVVSERDDVGADLLLGLPVTVKVMLPEKCAPFNGLVTRFVRTGEQTLGQTQPSGNFTAINCGCSRGCGS